MKKVKIGDEVLYTLWTGPERRAQVVKIEICEPGEKYGYPVTSCDIDSHTNGVLDLSDNHWCYFDQVKKVLTTKQESNGNN